MNWLEEYQSEEEDEEVYQQHNKYIQKLFPPREFQPFQKEKSMQIVDYRNIVNSLKCPICALIVQDPIYLSCSHRFCKACFMNQNLAISMTKNCPICNTYLESKHMVYDDFSMNLLTNNIYKWLLQFQNQRNKKILKREESTLKYNEQKVKIFKSNKGDSVIVKEQHQLPKFEVENSSKTQRQLDAETMCCEVDVKKQKSEKGLQIVKARSLVVLKPRQNEKYNSRKQINNHPKSKSKYFKVRIEKLPSDILSPKLQIKQILVRENSSVNTIATLVAQELNISPQQIDIFMKIERNFIQLKSKDIITDKMQDCINMQEDPKKILRCMKLQMSKFLQDEFSYQHKFRCLATIGRLYYSVRFSQMIAQ